MPENNIPLRGEFVLNGDKKERTAPVPATPPAQASQPIAPVPDPVKPIEKKANHHERKNMHFFSSLAHYPKNVVFQNQEADEEVVLVIRRDFITNLPWILGLLFAALILPVLVVAAPFFFTITISPALVFIIILFYYLVVFAFALVFFAIWYFNVGIVTNKRIVDLDVPNILVRHLSEARLNSIVDVSFSQIGGIRSFFDYGNVDIQTEALTQNIEFDRAPNPNFIRKVIGELIVERPGV